jgi:hypothetical protein
MHLIIKKAKEREIQVTAEQLRQHGRCAALFPGLADGSWFKRIDSFADKHGLMLGHYIVSYGTFEMIEGCPIYSKLKRVFASRFIYGDQGQAVWPGFAINTTNKTQFLFRINKGFSNSWNTDRLNEYVPDREREVPFRRMIFVGDGDTDIPCMKMTTDQGGYSVAVYDPKRNSQAINKIHKLIAQNRVSFVAPADYTKNSQIDIVIKGIMGRIALLSKEQLPVAVRCSF